MREPGQLVTGLLLGLRDVSPEYPSAYLRLASKEPVGGGPFPFPMRQLIIRRL